MSAKSFGLLAAGLVLIGGCARPEAPKESILRVVFFGDSITEAGVQPGGYVSLVEGSLMEAHADGAVEVIGAGISGHKVPDLQARVARDVLAHSPTHVVIYIGINDVWHHFSFDHVTGTEPDVYRTGLTDLVQTIQDQGAQVLLCTPSVIGEDPSSEAPVNQRLMEYAEISRDVAGATRASLCDLRAAFENHLAEHNTGKAYQGILTTDGVHLNEAGNRFVADFMLEHLQEALAQ